MQSKRTIEFRVGCMCRWVESQRDAGSSTSAISMCRGDWGSIRAEGGSVEDKAELPSHKGGRLLCSTQFFRAKWSADILLLVSRRHVR